MSKINVKKVILSIVIVISVIVILPKIVEIWYIKSKYDVPQTPQDDVLHNTTIYLIDPGTLLESLNDGHSDIFTPATADTEPSVSSLLPSNSFPWKEEDYLYIANALHEYEWKESLAKWELYSMGFSINRCDSVEAGIDFAELTYYQRQGNLYVVHGMWINPLLRAVTTGDNQYPYRKEWTSIDINTLAVKTPDAALKLAEASGGKNAREKEGENGCRIKIYLKSDVPAFGLFSNPFKLYSVGWEVKYWSSDSNIIFQESIDAYSGK